MWSWTHVLCLCDKRGFQFVCVCVCVCVCLCARVCLCNYYRRGEGRVQPFLRWSCAQQCTKNSVHRCILLIYCYVSLYCCPLMSLYRCPLIHGCITGCKASIYQRALLCVCALALQRPRQDVHASYVDFINITRKEKRNTIRISNYIWIMYGTIVFNFLLPKNRFYTFVISSGYTRASLNLTHFTP